MSDRETDRLSRPVFFDRQSLTRDDLNSLVDYVRETRRRHNRHVVGWGVACGLPVTAVDGAPWQVAVGPGYAITPSGEEVAVSDGAPAFDVCAAARACLDIPGPCPAPLDLDAAPAVPAATDLRSTDFTVLAPGSTGPNPRELGWATVQVFTFTGAPADVTRIQRFGPNTGLDLGRRTVVTTAAPADTVRVELAHAATPPVVVARDAAGAELDRQAVTAGSGVPQVLALQGPGITTVDIEAPQNEALLLQVDAQSTARGEVHLALCPDETPTRFRPGIPPHCRPPGDDIHPSRICEGYRLTVLCDLPEGHAPPSCDEIAAMICGPAHVPCPPPGGADCVVIATLSIGTDGILAIDEFSHRRRLLPQWVLAERERCRCAPPAPPDPTVFTPPTQPTEPTVFTPTVLTLFTRPTVFTPTIFTQLTLPSRFTLPSLFTFGPGGPGGPFVPGPGGPVVVGPDPLVFDPVVGRELTVDTVRGIGSARAARLRAIGVVTVTDLVERGSAEIAAALGLSEVRVAELQDVARRSTVERDG